jgi:hypothetical protein
MLDAIGMTAFADRARRELLATRGDRPARCHPGGGHRDQLNGGAG